MSAPAPVQVDTNFGESSAMAAALKSRCTLYGHCLLHTGHVDLALLCLRSLTQFSDSPAQITIHDDGSLTAHDDERLVATLPGLSIIARAEADERMEDPLRRRPACAAFRRANIFGLKL